MAAEKDYMLRNREDEIKDVPFAATVKALRDVKGPGTSPLPARPDAGLSPQEMLTKITAERAAAPQGLAAPKPETGANTAPSAFQSAKADPFKIAYGKISPDALPDKSIGSNASAMPQQPSSVNPNPVNNTDEPAREFLKRAGVSQSAQNAPAVSLQQAAGLARQSGGMDGYQRLSMADHPGTQAFANLTGKAANDPGAATTPAELSKRLADIQTNESSGGTVSANGWRMDDKGRGINTFSPREMEEINRGIRARGMSGAEFTAVGTDKTPWEQRPENAQKYQDALARNAQGKQSLSAAALARASSGNQGDYAKAVELAQGDGVLSAQVEAARARSLAQNAAAKQNPAQALSTLTSADNAERQAAIQQQQAAIQQQAENTRGKTALSQAALQGAQAEQINSALKKDADQENWNVKQLAAIEASADDPAKQKKLTEQYMLKNRMKQPGDDKRYLVVGGGSDETGRKLPARVFDQVTGKLVNEQGATGATDMRAEAIDAVKGGANKDAVNKRLVAAGHQPI